MEIGDAYEPTEDELRERERIESYLRWNWAHNLNRGDPNRALRALRESMAPAPEPPPPQEPPPELEMEPEQFDMGI